MAYVHVNKRVDLAQRGITLQSIYVLSLLVDLLTKAEKHVRVLMTGRLLGLCCFVFLEFPE